MFIPDQSSGSILPSMTFFPANWFAIRRDQVVSQKDSCSDTDDSTIHSNRTQNDVVSTAYLYWFVPIYRQRKTFLVGKESFVFASFTVQLPWVVSCLPTKRDGFKSAVFQHSPPVSQKFWCFRNRKRTRKGPRRVPVHHPHGTSTIPPRMQHLTRETKLVAQETKLRMSDPSMPG